MVRSLKNQHVLHVFETTILVNIKDEIYCEYTDSRDLKIDRIVNTYRTYYKEKKLFPIESKAKFKA